MSSDSRIRTGQGPRQVEALLLAELARLSGELREHPRLLAKPVRVVVPSRSLAEHVSRALVRHVGHAVAGVRVHTLHGLALEVLRASGEPARRGDDLFGVFVRRAARRQPALREALERLDDGYGAVVGAVSDLLDAGYDHAVAAHREALEDALNASALAHPTQQRVAALARVAGEAAAAMAEHELGRTGARIVRAAELLASDPMRLPTRALFVHGFADATGAASDLLQALMKLDGACLLLDQPADPARPERRDIGSVFTERLQRRVSGAAVATAAEPDGGEPTRVAAVRASGSEAEVRAAADRIHELLEAGVEAESIAIVARDLERYAVPLRTQLGRLGIPFSAGASVGPPSGRGRRAHGLLELVAERGATPAERWLEVLAVLGRGERADLRLAFHAVGAGRIADVAALDPEQLLQRRPALPLPARRGLSEGQEGEEERAAPYARRRSVPAQLLRDTVQRARDLVTHFEAWPRAATLAAHRSEMKALFASHLGWPPGTEREELERAGAELADAVPALEFEFEEYVLLLRRMLREAGSDRLGGAGAGVQLLSVVSARARTFDHLFLLGVNRDVFPRPLTEDPLLPDAVRLPLADVLPEIPVKARGFEEEHYLFAQLLGASPRVTLSWLVADDEGKARSPSPFIDRLRGAGVLGEVEDAPTLQAPPERSAGRPRTAAEAAVSEGLHGNPRRFAQLLPLVVDERRRFDAEPLASEAVAAGRIAVLQELAAGPGEARVGPYLGFVGPARLEQDLRRRPLYVTQLESMARCPWAFFVTRLLGLEPAPNALDALPEASALLLGNVVHGVLEAIGEASAPGGDGEAPPGGFEIEWPSSEALEAILQRVTEQVLSDEGIGPPAFAQVVARAARTLVEAARDHDWPAPGSEVRCLGVEQEGSLEVAEPGGETRTLRFRADRVDAVGGAERHVDYKCGKNTPGTKTKVREGLLAAVASGSYLQAPAYAFAAGGEGRYLFLHPDAAAPVFEVRAEDEDFRRHFEAAVATLIGALEQGAFVPRLVSAEGTGPHPGCARCEVHEACLQGDSGVRGRLAAWAERGRVESPVEEAALELWGLPERTPE